jgi:site-specific DNA-methyltransferase (adenine-specific)
MTARPTTPLHPDCSPGSHWQERLVLPGVELYLGDCREIAPSLQGVDAIISDPPYGMNWNTNGRRFSGGHRDRAKEWSRGRDWGKAIEGDTVPFDPAPWLEYPKVVLFGSNHFGRRLPVGTKLIWIKRHPNAFGTFLSDAEEAWMKGGHGIYCKQGPHPESMAKERAHPTQKPVELMAWCMDKAKMPEGATVLDPYMGSGSTIIAAIRTGRKAIGIEKDPTHFQTAVDRIRRELAQGDLFLGQNRETCDHRP